MSKILINKDVKVDNAVVCGMRADRVKEMYNKMLCNALNEYCNAEEDCDSVYNEDELLKAKFSSYMELLIRDNKVFSKKKFEIEDKIFKVIDKGEIETINEMIEDNKENATVLTQIDKWLCWKRYIELKEMMNRLGIYECF